MYNAVCSVTLTELGIRLYNKQEKIKSDHLTASSMNNLNRRSSPSRSKYGKQTLTILMITKNADILTKTSENVMLNYCVPVHIYVALDQNFV